ncbi:MAG: ATP-binding protein [bacterium]|nr:ATP-binding protein [bacterium]
MLVWEKMLFLLSVVTITSLAAFVIIRGRRDLIRITFSIFLLSVAALAANVYAIREAMAKSLIPALDILGRLSFAVGGLNCGALWAFTEVFPQPRKGASAKKGVLRAYAVGLAASLTALTPWFWGGVRFVGNDISPRLGYGAVPWCALLLFSLGAAVSNLTRNYLALPKGHLKNQVRYTFLGFSILAFPAAIFSVLLPSLGDVSYTSLVPFFGTITAVVITYAVVRHRLMDLGIVFRNTLIYMAAVCSVAALVVGFHILLSSALGFPFSLSVLLAATAVAAGFETLKRRISFLIDQYLFKGRYEYKKVVVEFGETISRILDLRELEKCVVEKTAEIMHSENGLMLVADARFEEYRTEYAFFPGTQVIMDRVLVPGNPLLDELRRTRKVVVEQEIRRTRTERSASSLLNEMSRLRSAIVIPLISKGQLLGVLSLGEKKSGDIYSAEDISLLTVLANQVAPSLENSRLFNEILVMKNHQDNILQHLRSGVITVDRNSRVKSANRRAAEILNRPRRDLLHQDVAGLGKELGRLAVQRLQEGFGHFEGEIQVDVPDKGTVPLSLVATTMAGERNGREVLLVFDDLSEVKLLQNRIRRADRLAVVGTFAAGMAHEIKNPLVPLKTFSQLLPEMFDDEEFRNRFSFIVLKEVERINQLIEKLLNFARPVQPIPAPCDVHELIDEVLLLLEEDFRRHRIELRREYTRDSALITVDRQQVKQVLLNILLNAVQAIEAACPCARTADVVAAHRTSRVGAGETPAATEGMIEVRTLYVWERPKDGDGRRPRAEAEESVGVGGRGAGVEGRLIEDEGKVRKFQVRISDTGCGIAEEDLKHLFNPFFTTKPEGTGLGLAISHVIIEEHGGTLDAESEKGKGATFTLTLPASNGS